MSGSAVTKADALMSNGGKNYKFQHSDSQTLSLTLFILNLILLRFMKGIQETFFLTCSYMKTFEFFLIEKR